MKNREVTNREDADESHPAAGTGPVEGAVAPVLEAGQEDFLGCVCFRFTYLKKDCVPYLFYSAIVCLVVSSTVYALLKK